MGKRRGLYWISINTDRGQENRGITVSGQRMRHWDAMVTYLIKPMSNRGD